MEEQLYYVYLLTNWNNKLLYIGVTNNLERRLYEQITDSLLALLKNTISTNWFISKQPMMSRRPLPERNN